MVVLIILSGVAIIGGTVFVIKDIEIKVVSTAFVDEETSKENMSAAVKDIKGKSILFNLDKDEIRTKIEAAEKLVKVVNIMAEFPNKVVIEVRERYPVFVFNKVSSGGNMVILDADMRVLYNDTTAWDGDYDKLVDISETGVLVDTFTVGDYASSGVEEDKEKIEQLQAVTKYFIGRGTHEDSISHMFNEILFIENGSVPAGVYAMYLDVKLKEGGKDAQITIKSQNVTEFKALFAWAWSCLENFCPYYDEKGNKLESGKPANAPGEYIARYTNEGHLVVEYNNTDPNFPNNPDAIFIEGV